MVEIFTKHKIMEYEREKKKRTEAEKYVICMGYILYIHCI